MMYTNKGQLYYLQNSKIYKKKVSSVSWGGAPLEGGARWLGHPSFYGSLAPDHTPLTRNSEQSLRSIAIYTYTKLD